MTLPTISSAPAAPQRGSDTPEEFSTKADAFAAWLEDAPTEFNAFAVALVDAAAAANYSANSTTSHNISTGAKTFTVDTGKLFVDGQFITIAQTGTPANYLYARVDDYNISTGALDVTVLRVGGSGSAITAWDIGLSGPQGEGGDVLPAFAGNAYKSLRVNAGESAAEWVDEGYVLIETLSPSGAASATSATLPGTYSDIYVRVSATIASGLGLAFSPDGSSYSSPVVVHSSVSAAVRMVIRFEGYNFDDGRVTANYTDSSSPGMAGSSAGSGWICTGGIKNLRFTNGSGNLTATIRIYGKR